MNLLRSIWKFWGRADLTLYLLLGLTTVLGIGFFYFRAQPQLFGPLDRLLLWDWVVTYGRFHLAQTWWFFGFMALIFMLMVNTLVCTVDKTAALIRRPARSDRLAYLLRFSPHLMHLAFIVLLGAMLLSYVTGENRRNNILTPGRQVALDRNGHKIRLADIKVDFYQGDRLSFLKGRAVDQDVTLVFTDPQGRETTKHLGLNRPVVYSGYSFHLKNYRPQYQSQAKRPGFVNLIIRRDPGVRVFFTGLVIFVLGLIGYLVDNLRKARPAKEPRP